MPHWSEQDWNEIDLAVAALQRVAEGEDRIAAIQQAVPAPGSPSRTAVLLTLVKIELEAGYTRGQGQPIECYLELWPELAEDPACLSDLIEAECRAILQASGEAPDLEEYRRRFPDWRETVDVRELQRESRESDSDTDGDSESLLQTLTRSIQDGREFQAVSLPIGAQLDRYRILSVLGKGAMGMVYLAKDSLLDRLVAIKVLHARVAEESTLQTLCDEARAAARLQHPSIVPVYDVGVSESGTPFLVMALVEGESLYEELARGPLSPPRAVQVARQLAGALAVAHGAGFMHRDIKPANILIDLEGNAYITDFGLAVSHESDAAPTHLAGTPAYMAPEQLTGQQLDHRADIWALGVVLYEMLTGELPYQAESVDQLTRSIRDETGAHAAILAKGVPRSLAQTCAKCLQPRPDKRFSTAEELESALQSPQRTRRAVLLSVASVALLLLTTSPWIPSLWRRPPSKELSLIPWMEECELGMAVNLPGYIDLDKLQSELRQSPMAFFADGPIRVHTSRRGQYRYSRRGDWVCFEGPLAFADPLLKPGTHAISTPVEFDLRVRAAVNSRGRVIVGTIGEQPQHHLLLLTTSAGVENYSAFNDSKLPSDEFGVPKDVRLENGPWQSQYGKWVRSIAVALDLKKVSRFGPTSNAQLRDGPVAFFNHLDTDITVVTTALFNQQFTHVWHRDERSVLADKAATTRWSPIADNPSQHADLATTFRFRPEESSASAMTVFAHSDGEEEGVGPNEFNASQITVQGVHRDTTVQDVANGTLASIQFHAEGGKTRITAANQEVSDATLMVYDLAPEVIEIQARTTYSKVDPMVRFATLDEVHVGSVQWSPQERSGKQIQPMIWRIRRSQK